MRSLTQGEMGSPLRGLRGAAPRLSGCLSRLIFLTADLGSQQNRSTENSRPPTCTLPPPSAARRGQSGTRVAMDGPEPTRRHHLSPTVLVRVTLGIVRSMGLERCKDTCPP